MTAPPDIARAIEFLLWAHGEIGVYSVGAIDPDDPRGLAWLTTENLAEVEAFLVEQGAKRRNLYYQWNLPSPAIGAARASKADIVYAVGAHVDVDPPDTATDLASLRAWQAETAHKFERTEYWTQLGLPSPTAVVFSGSGFQVLWRYLAPLCLWREEGDTVVQDPMLVEHIEEINYSILQRVDPAHAGTQNADRLLRVPGTLNWPSAKKRAKGRTEPELAIGVWSDARVDAFAMPRVPLPRAASAAPPRATIQLEAGSRVTREWLDANIPAWLVEDVVNGPGPGGDRSKAGFAATCALIREGIGDEAITAILGDPSLKISGHYLDQADTDRAIDRAIGAAHDQVDAELVADREFGSWVERLAKRVVAAPPSPTTAAPPTGERITSHLRAARDRLKRSTNPEKRHDGAMLSRVIEGDLITDVGELVEAAVAIVRHAPDGATPEQLAGELRPSAGARASDALDIITAAAEHVRAKADVAADDFSVDAESGRPYPNQRNIDIALARLGVALSYDLLARRKLVERDGAVQIVEDEHIVSLRLEIERAFEFLVQKELIYDVVDDRARARSFHPVRDYLDSLPEWDGANRLDTWLIRLTGAADTPFVRAVSRLILVAAVRRIRSPGCKFDEMLVLESTTQGTDKTSFVRALCARTEWFGSRLPLHADVKRQMEATAGKWIVEAGELSGMDKADHRALKDYLSTQVDEARMAYGREVRIVPRHFVVIGTTNDKRYLKDQKNRRYWPIEIVRCDVAGLVAEREQLWKEAVLAEQAGESIRLDEALWADAEREQEERRIMDPFEILIVPALEDLTGILAVEEAWRMCGFEDRKPSQSEMQRISDIITTRLHWTHTRRRKGGKRVPCYASSEAAEQWLQVVNVGGAWQCAPVQGAKPSASLN